MKSVLKFCRGFRKAVHDRVTETDFLMTDNPFLNDDKKQILKDVHRKKTGVNVRGNYVSRMFSPDERYVIDFADDFTAEGWLQFDTSQDAHYFGFWVNPKYWLTLTYCEGDWSLVDCPTEESYRDEIRDAIKFYGEGFICKALGDDGWTTYVQDREAIFLAGTAR